MNPGRFASLVVDTSIPAASNILCLTVGFFFAFSSGFSFFAFPLFDARICFNMLIVQREYHLFCLMGYLLFPIVGFPEIICRGFNSFRTHKLQLNILIFCVNHCCIRIRFLKVLKNAKLSLFVSNWPEGL